MLFSVLLPTHNGLEFLRHAVESVRRQDAEDWELVISDNASTDDIAGYVASLGDGRIRYVSTDRFVPVTENWNNALRHSSGDYLIMLGNDDALLPGYFSSVRALLARWGDPDAVYLGAYVFAYPGVLPDAPRGYLRPNLNANFFARQVDPFVLGRGEARELVRAAAQFRVQYDFNMQYVTVSRRLVDRLRDGGEFFRSPFPDYYAMNHVFAEAETIVVDPIPRVIVGITRASHGYLHYNRREHEARSLLGTDAMDGDVRRELADVILPGTNINTSWLLSMEMLYRRLGRPEDLRPDYERYRRLQALHCVIGYYIHRTVTREELSEALSGLRWWERLVVRAFAPAAGDVLRRTPGLRDRLGWVLDTVVGQVDRSSPAGASEEGVYRDAIEVFERFEPPPALTGDRA